MPDRTIVPDPAPDLTRPGIVFSHITDRHTKAHGSIFLIFLLRYKNGED